MALDETSLLPVDRIPRIDGLPSSGAIVIGHRVEACETSALVPHANNIVILSWIDAAASLHGDLAGASRASLAARGKMWFVARHEVDYRAEVFPGDALEVYTWVRTMGRSTSWRDTRIVRAGDGTPVCAASTLWAFVDLATRRPVRIPPEFRTAFDPLEAAPCSSRSSSIPAGS